MGLNQTREVRTTFLCDFCKHEEVVVAEYSQEGLPTGWSALALVPADQRPRAEPFPKYSGYTISGDPDRYCLSSDREVNLAHACPACSAYGLQAIKLNKVEKAPDPNSELFKLTKKGFYALVAFSISLGAIAGFLAGILLRR